MAKPYSYKSLKHKHTQVLSHFYCTLFQGIISGITHGNMAESTSYVKKQKKFSILFLTQEFQQHQD